MSTSRVILITGVTSGIGQATAALLSDRGFQVFGTMRKPAEVAGLPANVTVVQLDVRDAESARACVQTVLDRAGRIDALVNNAGSMLIGSLEETSLEEARQIFETNFFGVMRMTREVLPVLRRQNGGQILNISSVVGFLPAPYAGVYSASKHALEGYSESLDHEVRHFGIRVSLIEPGFTRTNLSRNGMLAGQLLPAYEAERNRSFHAFTESVAKGEDPSIVAGTVLKALTSYNPHLRYPAGRGARSLAYLRRFAPSRLLDRGLRKQFGLDAA